MPGLISLLTLLTVTDHGDVNAELVRRAEQAFHQGVAAQARVQEARRHFAQAAELFGELHSHGVRSPALYLDLGNAEYLAGRPERALWAYQSGLRLDPRDQRLRENLQQVRAGIHYPAGGRARLEPEIWPQAKPVPLLVAAFATYALACLVATLWFYRPAPALMGSLCALAVATTVSLVALARVLAQAEHDRLQPVVVVSEETPLYRGNGPSYPPHPDLPSLPRGVEARQLLRRGSWLQVQCTSGEIGWMPARTVLVVETPSAPGLLQ
jgi:hypothetical protein